MIIKQEQQQEIINSRELNEKWFKENDSWVLNYASVSRFEIFDACI